jgi:hypothetical protein
MFEVWVDEFITATIRLVEDWDIALGRSFLHPVLEFVSDTRRVYRVTG